MPKSESFGELFRQRWVVLSIILMMLIVFLSPFFGYAFEPLDFVAEKFEAVEKTVYEAPLPDYTTPGIGGDIGGIIAGIVGTLIVLVISLAVGYVLRSKEVKK